MEPVIFPRMHTFYVYFPRLHTFDSQINSFLIKFLVRQKKKGSYNYINSKGYSKITHFVEEIDVIM